MTFDKKLEDAIEAEASRSRPVAGWSLEIERTEAGRLCTLTNTEGLSETFTVKKENILSDEQIIEKYLHGFVDKVEARRRKKEIK